MKEHFKERLALGVTIAGVAGSVASWSTDVITCPGPVEHPKDTPILVCDENPNSDNILDNPGTIEQKLLYGSIVIGTMGGLALARSRRKNLNIKPAPMQK